MVEKEQVVEADEDEALEVGFGETLLEKRGVSSDEDTEDP